MDATASENERLMDRVVLITGCGSGLGEALAQVLHTETGKHGEQLFRVYATARRAEALHHLAEDGIATLALDVGSTDSVAAAIAEVTTREGRIDVLINNAGISKFGPLAEQPLKEVADVLDTNLMGVLRAVIPAMAQRGSGLIVNVGSVSGWLTTPFAGAYCASKAALNAVSDALRLELRPFGIHVTTVTAGAIISRLSDNAAGGMDMARYEGAGSLYASRAGFIRARVAASQDDHAAQPAAQVASQIVTRIRAATGQSGKAPPASFLAGGKALTFWFLGLLQMLFGRSLDNLIARKFGL